MRELEEFRPDVIVNLGDWFEGKPAKRWPAWSDETWTLEDEFNAVAAQAEEINAIAPQAKKYWLYGNHDDNLFGSQPGRIPNDLQKTIQWRNNPRLTAALKDWRITEKYGHRERLRLGPVTFQHGCDAAISAEKNGGYLYGSPFGLYVCGHTHRPVRVTRAEERGIYLPYWYCNPGCGVQWDRMHYMTRLKMAKWGRGLIVGEMAGVEQSRSAYASKQWDAELKIQSMAHE